MTNDLIYFSKGNHKLIPNDSIEFAIWSLPAVETCPYATEHCIKNCYARKAENLYPSCYDSRYRNYEATLREDFVLLVIEYLEKRLASKAHKGKRLIVRIHESGDFYSADYCGSWICIALHFKGRTDITFMAYTKSIRLFEFNPIQCNLILRFSLWDDTSLEDIKRAGQMNIPMYTVCKPEYFKWLPTVCQCHCEDCGKCLKCYDILSVTNLYVVMH